MHPAYVDIFCDRHEHWHQSDVCPICELEDAPEYCEEHDLEYEGDECPKCEHNRLYQICEDHGEFYGKSCCKCRAESFAEDVHMERYYESKYGRGEP